MSRKPTSKRVVVLLTTVIFLFFPHFSQAESEPDAVSREVVEQIIFSDRDDFLRMHNINPQTWSATLELGSGELFRITYLDEVIVEDSGEKYYWRSLIYTYYDPDGIQVIVRDKGLNGSATSLNINGRIVYEENGVEVFTPERVSQAQMTLDAFRDTALQIARGRFDMPETGGVREQVPEFDL